MGTRIRIYELARELGLTNAELIDLLRKEGIEVKSHASTIEEELAELVRDQVISKRQAQQGPVIPPEVLGDETESTSAETAEEEEADIEEAAEETGGTAEIHLKPPVVLRDLAEKLGKKPNELIGELMTLNVFATINQVIDTDIVRQLCERHGFELVTERRTRKAKEKAKGKGRKEKAPATKPAAITEGTAPRPPVVTFLGHVDHGKTSLQDAIRETKVTADEAGGITQHIGASSVYQNGQKITFVDTPGHEAFTSMRARGANVTDVAIIVVAADDGVMPQTIEAINHARAADVPIVVALNKMDLPGANPDKVLVGLQQQEINVEDWGGDVGVVRVSAVTKDGLDDLLERILLEAEMLELKCTPSKAGQGVVLEAELESGMGATTNVLVRDGTIHVGDIILCGQHYGRIKALIDGHGNRVDSAGPSDAVRVLGLSGVPQAGQEFTTVAKEREAKAVAQKRATEARQQELSVSRHTNLEDLFQQIEQESLAELKLILKADVRGSLEAITDSLEKMKSEKIRLNILHTGVGEITENDVLLAAASDAILVGFHVRVMPAVNRTAKREGVQIRLYTVIYELLEDIEDAMRGQLAPEEREKVLGNAEILKVFNVSRTGKICGCVVNDGLVRVGAGARVYRENELLYKGRIQSLRRYQDDVREVRSGIECGIKLDHFEDFEVGDVVEAFEVEKLAPEL